MTDINKKADVTTIVGVLQVLAGLLITIPGVIIFLFSKVWPFFVAAGVFFIWRGFVNYKLASRFRRIYRALGEDTHITLDELERRLDWKSGELLRVLHRQAAHGFWQNSYLDADRGIFALDYNPKYLTAGTGDSALNKLLDTVNDSIHEMTTINHAIENTDLNAEVDVLIDITKQIYAYIEKNPEKSTLIRQFTNYYLPTTLNLLNDYLDLQNQTVKSETMIESMQKISEAMTTIETAFKEQLNNLYNEKAMDVTVEIEVMKKMIDM